MDAAIEIIMMNQRRRKILENSAIR